MLLSQLVDGHLELKAMIIPAFATTMFSEAWLAIALVPAHCDYMNILQEQQVVLTVLIQSRYIHCPVLLRQIAEEVMRSRGLH